MIGHQGVEHDGFDPHIANYFGLPGVFRVDNHDVEKILIEPGNHRRRHLEPEPPHQLVRRTLQRHPAYKRAYGDNLRARGPERFTDAFYIEYRPYAYDGVAGAKNNHPGKLYRFNYARSGHGPFDIPENHLYHVRLHLPFSKIFLEVHLPFVGHDPCLNVLIRHWKDRDTLF